MPAKRTASGDASGSVVATGRNGHRYTDEDAIGWLAAYLMREQTVAQLAAATDLSPAKVRRCLVRMCRIIGVDFPEDLGD